MSALCRAKSQAVKQVSGMMPPGFASRRLLWDDTFIVFFPRMRGRAVDPSFSPGRAGGELMLNTRDASEVLNRDFLEARCKILEIAAILDRIDRAPSKHHDQPDPRMSQLRQALEALSVPDPGRAETIQLI